MKRVLFVLAWVFFAFRVSSQFYTFTGKVMTTGGIPLTGANVWFENSYSGTVSYLNGDFSFKRLPAGSYHFAISFLGYETHREKIVFEICQINPTAFFKIQL